VKPCILAGCPPQETVLDPFAGTGMVGHVAEKLNRNAILIELNPVYVEMQKGRNAIKSVLDAGAAEKKQADKKNDGWLF